MRPRSLRFALPALFGLLAIPAAAVLRALAAPAAAPADEVEAILRATPGAASFSRHLLYLTEEPHPAGSPRNMELADYVRDRFIEYGLEDVRPPADLSRGGPATDLRGDPGRPPRRDPGTRARARRRVRPGRRPGAPRPRSPRLPGRDPTFPLTARRAGRT